MLKTRRSSRTRLNLEQLEDRNLMSGFTPPPDKIDYKTVSSFIKTNPNFTVNLPTEVLVSDAANVDLKAGTFDNPLVDINVTSGPWVRLDDLYFAQELLDSASLKDNVQSLTLWQDKNDDGDFETFVDWTQPDHGLVHFQLGENSFVGRTRMLSLQVKADIAPDAYGPQIGLELLDAAFTDLKGNDLDPDKVVYSGNLTNHPITINDADFVSSTGVPSWVVAGQSFTSTLTFTNNSELTWNAYDYALVSDSGLGSVTGPLWGVDYVPLDHDVLPGESVTFTINATAPTDPGLYFFDWQMSEYGTGFGQTSYNDITVVEPKSLVVTNLGFDQMNSNQFLVAGDKSPVLTTYTINAVGTPVDVMSMTFHVDGASNISSQFVKPGSVNTEFSAVPSSNGDVTITFTTPVHIAAGGKETFDVSDMLKTLAGGAVAGDFFSFNLVDVRLADKTPVSLVGWMYGPFSTIVGTEITKIVNANPNAIALLPTGQATLGEWQISASPNVNGSKVVIDEITILVVSSNETVTASSVKIFNEASVAITAQATSFYTLEGTLITDALLTGTYVVTFTGLEISPVNTAIDSGASITLALTGQGSKINSALASTFQASFDASYSLLWKSVTGTKKLSLNGADVIPNLIGGTLLIG